MRWYNSLRMSRWRITSHWFGTRTWCKRWSCRRCVATTKHSVEARRESRGTHTHENHLDRNDEDWMKHTSDVSCENNFHFRKRFTIFRRHEVNWIGRTKDPACACLCIERRAFVRAFNLAWISSTIFGVYRTHSHVKWTYNIVLYTHMYLQIHWSIQWLERCKTPTLSQWIAKE